MKLKAIASLYEKVLGINQRNLNYIYPSNPRHYFPMADDKVLTKEFLSRFGIPMPPTYYVISTMREINAQWEGINRLIEFAIKPSKGRAGGGILVLKKQNDEWIDPSNQSYTEKEIKKRMADIIFGIYSFGLWDKVLIEYRVHPHSVFWNIFPLGVADIRIIVYNHEPKMSMARIPTYKSRGKANLHQGCIGVSIDLKTGRMGEGYDYRSYFSRHPDTGIEFRGVQIPFWEEILEMSKKIGHAVPLHYIGVDVVLDQEKGPLLMEINARPGLEIQNVNRMGLRPLLEKAQR